MQGGAMTSFRELIGPFRDRRAETVGALATVGEKEITANVEGGGDVRYCLWRIVIATNQRRVELGQTLAALGWHQSDGQRILALAAATGGQLRPILVRRPDELARMATAPGKASSG